MTSFRKLFGALAAAAFLLSAIAPPALAQSYNPAGASGYSGPIAIGQNTGGLTGAYRKSMSTGTMAAGLASDSPVFSFRYGGTGYAVIRSVTISAVNAGTAFTAGVGKLELYKATAFTASDSGGTAGTLTAGGGDRLRTSLAVSAVSDFRIASTGALTAGTRTLGTDPLASTVVAVPATSTNYQMIVPGTTLYNRAEAGDYPLTLTTSEGFVIQATVPATGTWTATVSVQWDEYAAF